MTIARKVIAKLQAENSTVLSDATPKKYDEYDLSKVDANTPPSEIRRLTEAVKHNRLTGEGLKEEELKALMGRLKP